MKSAILTLTMVALAACGGGKKADEASVTEPFDPGSYLCRDEVDDEILGSVKLQYTFTWVQGVGSTDREFSVLNDDETTAASSNDLRQDDIGPYYEVNLGDEVGSFKLYPNDQNYVREYPYGDTETFFISAETCELVE